MEPEASWLCNPAGPPHPQASPARCLAPPQLQKPRGGRQVGWGVPSSFLHPWAVPTRPCSRLRPAVVTQLSCSAAPLLAGFLFQSMTLPLCCSRVAALPRSA